MEIIISYLVKAFYSIFVMQDTCSFLIYDGQKLLMMNKPSWAIATEGGGVLRRGKGRGKGRCGIMTQEIWASITLRQNDLLHLLCVTLLMKCIRNKSEFENLGFW